VSTIGPRRSGRRRAKQAQVLSQAMMAASLAARSSVTGAVRRHEILLESVDSLVCHRLYYIEVLKKDKWGEVTLYLLQENVKEEMIYKSDLQAY